MSAFPRPVSGEHAEYYGRYVEQVPDGDILVTLRDQLGETVALLEGVPEERETFRYAEGKWSLREVVGHLVDTEWLFSFRALVMAREEGVTLPGMDQDAWAASSRAHETPLAHQCAQWIALRRAAIHMFATMSPEHAARTGVASGYDFTVRAFPWIIAGHELWHRGLIERDYLKGGG